MFVYVLKWDYFYCILINGMYFKENFENKVVLVCFLKDIFYCSSQGHYRDYFDNKTHRTEAHIWREKLQWINSKKKNLEIHQESE